MGYIYLPASNTQGCVPLPLHSARFYILLIKSLPVWSRKSSKYFEDEVGYGINKYQYITLNQMNFKPYSFSYSFTSAI